MTSFLKPPQKDSRKLITDSAHEDKKGRANNSRRESKQMSELKAREYLTRSKWKPLHLCRDNLRRGQSRNHKVWWEEAGRKSGLRAVRPHRASSLPGEEKGGLLSKKPNQRAVVTTPTTRGSKDEAENRWDFQSVQWANVDLPLPGTHLQPIIAQKTVTAAAAKSRQSCLTLCVPIDSSPPGSPVPGILQARTLEWVATSFSNAWKWKVKVKSLSCVQLFATPWTAPLFLWKNEYSS